MTTNKAYYVYIITNFQKTVLYTGVTNNLEQRIIEHYRRKGNTISFTGRYHAFYLLYYECSPYILNSIAREKEIKGWKRSKKEKLIREFNPAMKFLNEELFGQWPRRIILFTGNIHNKSCFPFCIALRNRYLLRRYDKIETVI